MRTELTELGLEVQNLLKDNNLRVNADYLDLCKLNESKECGLHL